VVKVERAYGDPNDPNDVLCGSVVGTIRYDGLARRIVKQPGEGNGLTREPRMSIPLYPWTFTDGTRISEFGGHTSQKAKELFGQLERFVNAAYGSQYPAIPRAPASRIRGAGLVLVQLEPGPLHGNCPLRLS
jgi:hypothetical protein